ncbi:BglG family transcription antiterminator [Acerihabitans sp.]|uniref:BglG family transcription antiterminator n=1 Tax=Acerihabitans sp. TaxID=2811394 RepID=UPI002EDAC638
MQNKHLKLLRLFLDSDEELTAHVLAMNMSVTDRSVKSYIAEINVQEPGLVQSSHRGYWVDKTRAMRALSSHAGKMPQTPGERVNYLLTQLLNNRLPGQPPDLYALGEVLCVSYETIKKDLLLVRKKLKEFNLYLTVANDRLTLEGQEQDKRRMFSGMLFAEFSDNILSLEEIGKIFPQYDINQLVYILVEACKSYHYFINEYALLSLVLDVVISIDRIRNNCTFTQSPTGERRYDEHETTLARQVIADIERSFDVIYTPQETEGLTVVLLSSLIRIDMEEIHSGNIEALAGKECMDLVRALREEMRRYDFIDGDSEQFLVRFTIHIKNLLVRLQHGHVTRNPLTEHIKASCPLIFECAVAISEKIRQATGFTVDEHEIAYIALHIGSILGDQNAEQNKVSCVLLVPHYHNHTNQLLSQIAGLFGQQLIIRAIVTSYREFENLPTPDFLISTLQIPQSMMEWVYINPFLTDRDISALQYKIERVRQKKKRARLLENLLKISNEHLFFRNPPVADENAAIPLMAEALRRHGYVDATFMQDVFQRERNYSTTFGNIAVPHSMKMNATKTGLSVVITDKPFTWGDNMVNVVLMFSISRGERALFYDIFDNLIVLLLEPINLKKVKECQTWEQFVATMVECF